MLFCYVQSKRKYLRVVGLFEHPVDNLQTKYIYYNINITIKLIIITVFMIFFLTCWIIGGLTALFIYVVTKYSETDE